MLEFRINALNFRLPWQSIHAQNPHECSQGYNMRTHGTVFTSGWPTLGLCDWLLWKPGGTQTAGLPAVEPYTTRLK